MVKAQDSGNVLEAEPQDSLMSCKVSRGPCAAPARGFASVRVRPAPAPGKGSVKVSWVCPRLFLGPAGLIMLPELAGAGSCPVGHRGVASARVGGHGSG